VGVFLRGTATGWPEAAWWGLLNRDGGAAALWERRAFSALLTAARLGGSGGLSSGIHSVGGLGQGVWEGSVVAFCRTRWLSSTAKACGTRRDYALLGRLCRC